MYDQRDHEGEKRMALKFFKKGGGYDFSVGKVAPGGIVLGNTARNWPAFNISDYYVPGGSAPNGIGSALGNWTYQGYYDGSGTYINDNWVPIVYMDFLLTDSNAALTSFNNGTNGSVSTNLSSVVNSFNVPAGFDPMTSSPDPFVDLRIDYDSMAGWAFTDNVPFTELQANVILADGPIYAAQTTIASVNDDLSALYWIAFYIYASVPA